MRLELEAFGDVQFSREILRVGANARNMRPAFDEIHDIVRGAEKQQFSTQGAAFSGGWKPLAPSTVAEKAAKGLDRRILHRTLRLRTSLTTKHGRDHVYRATADEMFVGTRVSYARWHQLGTERMPQRRPFELNDAVRREIVRVLQRHLVDTGGF